jgi:prepilin-type N-terminal cleavage/methylation domain-containing protein
MFVTVFLKMKFKIAPRGFTLVELMVTLAIVVLVTGVIMVQYSSFNNSVLLTNQAYLTSFDIREVQSLAVSVRGRSSVFDQEYGIYFDITKPNQYQLFQDTGTSNPVRYDSGEAIGSPYLIDPRFTILNICVSDTTSKVCSDTSSLENVTLSFQRPDFDADFYSSAKSNIQSMEITIGAVDGDLTKTITIYETGQISID